MTRVVRREPDAPLPILDHRRLPPELWIRILQFVTNVPGQLDVEIHDPFDDPYAMSLSHVMSPRSSRAHLLAIQAARVSVVRVCRMWRTLSEPDLYATVHISGSGALVKFAHILTHLDVRRRDMIHRLDLMMVDPGPHTSDAMDALAVVFSHLSNLEILNVCTTASEQAYVPRPAMCALRDTCRTSLKRLHWDPSSALRSSLSDTQSALCAFKCLTTLGRLWWPDCGGYTPGCPYTLPVMKKLDCLILPYGHSDHCSPAPQYPSLQKVIVGRSAPEGCVDSFISEHAQSLRIAFIEVVEENQSLSAFMTCSGLVHLVLFMTPETVRAISCWRIPPTVSHLGVYVHPAWSKDNIRRELIVLLGHLSSMEAVGLSVVRLLHLSKHELESFLRSDGFGLVYDLFARAGWALEDRMGHLLTPST